MSTERSLRHLRVRLSLDRSRLLVKGAHELDVEAPPKRLIQVHRPAAGQHEDVAYADRATNSMT